MKKSNKTKKIRLRTIKPVTIEEFQRIYGISDAKLKKLRKLVGQV
jgi:tRNA U34 5-carboxymethylaminomethyl modifying enzyme MnmG/GidA